MKKELVATQQHQQEEMRRLALSHKQKIEDMTKAEAQKKQLYKELKQQLDAYTQKVAAMDKTEADHVRHLKEEHEMIKRELTTMEKQQREELKATG